jgi:dipeptidyl aminopeptidase/acylaminoacyl peptidase
MRTQHLWYSKCIIVIINLFLVACTQTNIAMELPNPVLHKQTIIPSETKTPPVFTKVPNTPTPSPIPDKISTLTPTIDPYQDLYIASLKNRKYGGGVLQNEGLLNEEVGFKRFQFKYRSEGLDLFGFMNVPDGAGPFPVIILLHGSVDFIAYQTVDYTRRYADALAQAGFIAINPNLRGYAPSQDGNNDFGVGDTIDTLNLISLVRTQSGLSGLLEKADKDLIGLWGHSMGGGIVLRALIIDPGIKAGLLYASVNSNEVLNLSHFGNDGRRETKLKVPDVALKLISPAPFLEAIIAPLSIHHGAKDETVPVKWSQDLCIQLQDLGKHEECYLYPDQAHTFQNSGDTLFIKRMIEFFDKEIK